MTALAPYRKAVVASLVAGLTTLAVALEDGSVSAQEWVYVVIAVLTAGGTTYVVPNRDR